MRVVAAAHATCGAETRIRLPGYLPSRAVRRVVCGACSEVYEVGALATEGDLLPATEGSDPRGLSAEGAAPPRPRGSDPALSDTGSRLPHPSSRVWTYLGIPLAAAAVIAALILLQDGEDPSPTVTVGAPGTASAPDASPAQGGGGDREGAAAGAAEAGSGARFVTQPGYSLALPPGWEQTQAEGGAAFTAAAEDGTADATLWIERAPDLSLAQFEERSLEQLRSLTGNAEVVERIPAPTAAGTSVRLRADTPEGTGVSAPYDVTLRAAGPFRYYLATTVQPDASRQAREGADLIHGSFVPEPEGGGEVATGAAPGSEDSAAPAGGAGGDPAP